MRKVHIGYLVLLMASFMTGCVTTPGGPVSTLHVLEQAEATLETGWRTYTQAVHLGGLTGDDQYKVYTVLDKADGYLDQAWDVYANGDDAGARTRADLAVSLYANIRPLLIQAAGGAQ
jgi:hypothetical protein